MIVYDTQTDLKRQLERARHPDVSATCIADLADITQTIRALGARVGLQRRRRRGGRRIEQQLAAIADARRRAARAEDAARVRTRAGRAAPVDASGGYGFLHDLLELAGGADVLGDMRRQSVQMSTEMILTRAPEVIIELHYGAVESRRERLDAERRVWNALPSVPAVKNRRVYLLVGDEFVVPGPRIVTAAERFARALHPEAFK